MPSTPRSVVLLSLDPEFARRIYSGTKKVELRRTRPARRFTRAFVYETKHVGCVTGWFEVRWVRTLSPTAAWSRFGKWSGLSRTRFRSYFRNCRQAVIIRIGKVRQFDSPLRLRAQFGVSRPPQSFRYLPIRNAGARVAGNRFSAGRAQ